MKIKNLILIILFVFCIIAIYFFNAIFKATDTMQNIETYRARDIAYFAKSGDAEAQYNLAGCYHQGYGVEQSYEQAVFWFIKAAEQGHEIAQYRLSICYYDGLGVEYDGEQGTYWLMKSAENGYAEAEYMVGVFYHFGNLGIVDYEQAVFWYTKAAEQGHENAVKMLDRIREQNIK